MIKRCKYCEKEFESKDEELCSLDCKEAQKIVDLTLAKGFKKKERSSGQIYGHVEIKQPSKSPEKDVADTADTQTQTETQTTLKGGKKHVL